MERLTPERETELRKKWEGTRTEEGELLQEIDALRSEVEHLKLVARVNSRGESMD